MRHNKARATTLAVVVLGLVLLCTGPWAQIDPDDPIIWSTYHYDSAHTGQNSNSMDIENPATIDLIWVFPRGIGGVDEKLTIVDDLDVPDFLPNPAWQDSYTATDSFEAHFYHSRAVSSTNLDEDGNLIGTPITAVWKLPEELPRGYYQVHIWVPSEYEGDTSSKPRNTTQAR